RHRSRPSVSRSCTSSSICHPSDTLGEGTQELSDTTTITRRISLAPDVDLLPLLGRNDDHLRTLEHELDIRIVARGHDIMLKGDERQVRKAEGALVQLADLVRAGTPVRTMEVRAALRMLADNAAADLKAAFTDAVAVAAWYVCVTP